MKTPGQLTYEADCRACPIFHNGETRTPWARLDSSARWSWERLPDPGPREWVADTYDAFLRANMTPAGPIFPKDRR